MDEAVGSRTVSRFLLIPGIWDLKVGIFLVLVCLELGTSLAFGSWRLELFLGGHACSSLFMLGHASNLAGGEKI
jgi:hypothetical protein